MRQERGSASQLGRGLGGAADDALDLAERGDGAGRHGRTPPRRLGRDGPRLRRAGRLRPVGRQARRRLRGKGKRANINGYIAMLSYRKYMIVTNRSMSLRTLVAIFMHHN